MEIKPESWVFYLFLGNVLSGTSPSPSTTDSTYYRSFVNLSLTFFFYQNVSANLT